MRVRDLEEEEVVDGRRRRRWRVERRAHDLGRRAASEPRGEDHAADREELQDVTSEKSVVHASLNDSRREWFQGKKGRPNQAADAPGSVRLTYSSRPPSATASSPTKVRDACRAGVGDGDLGDRRNGRLPRPIPLPLTHHAHPGGRNGAGLDHSLHRRFVRLAGRAAGRVPVTKKTSKPSGQTVDHRICQADLGPKRCKDQLPAPRLFHCLDDPTVLPSVERRSIDRLLIGEDVLHTLDEIPATLLGNRGEDGAGTLNAFAAFARPTTLFTIIVGSWL